MKETLRICDPHRPNRPKMWQIWSLPIYWYEKARYIDNIDFRLKSAIKCLQAIADGKHVEIHELADMGAGVRMIVDIDHYRFAEHTLDIRGK